MKTYIILGLVSIAYAGVQQSCPASGICYSLNIPDTSSGDGDIYMQISAPTSYSWVGLGQGSQMAGAQIFVIYADSSGNNVTLSPRLGTGHVMPTYNSKAQVSLLDGSGISNGQMTANIKCSSCSSWSGGSMDLTGSSFGFIYAAVAGKQLNSDSPSETIQQHGNIRGSFSFSTDAKGGSDVNPFSSSNGTSTTNSGNPSGTSSNQNCVQAATRTGGSSATSGTPPSYGGPPSGFPTGGFWGQAPPGGFPPTGFTKRDAGNVCSNTVNDLSPAFISRGPTVLVAHGVLAALAFVILLPTGAISIRLMSFPGLLWFHAILQGLGFLCYVVAFGMGIWLATNFGYLHKYHPIIGILLFVLLFFQPLLGFLHHSGYKKYQRRTIWSHGHIWNGRIVITLGIINGGLGLILAGNTKTGPIAYGIIAAVIWLTYVAAIIIGEKRKARDMPPKYEDAVRLSNRRQSQSSEEGPGGYYQPRYR